MGGSAQQRRVSAQCISSQRLRPMSSRSSRTRDARALQDSWISSLNSVACGRGGAGNGQTITRSSLPRDSADATRLCGCGPLSQLHVFARLHACLVASPMPHDVMNAASVRSPYRE